jgi:hypothetical protein
VIEEGPRPDLRNLSWERAEAKAKTPYYTFL